MKNEFEEKKIICKDCGKEFPWTAGEQSFYAEKGLNAPIRCKECRAARKAKFEVKEVNMVTEQVKPETKKANLDDMLEKFMANTVSIEKEKRK